MSAVNRFRGLGLGVFIWILAIPIFLFTVFPLVSCVSSATDGIYLVEMLWDSDSKTWLRVGYYGLCLKEGGSSRCSTTTGTTAKKIGEHWGTTDDESIDGIKFGMRLQHDVFVAFMTAGGVDWLISLILATVVVLRASRAGCLLRTAARVTAVTTAMLMFASAWATTSAAEALAVVSSSKGFHQGTLLKALQWIAAILSFGHAYLVTTVAAAENGGKKGENNYAME